MILGKRYWWLKLPEDFFRQLEIKKLRKIAGGDTYTIIYLKMMLLSLKTDGYITYEECTEEEFISNLALEIDESEANVSVTVAFLLKTKMLVTTEKESQKFLPKALEATGTETAGAMRVREYRARQKALQCNTDVTEVKRRDRDRDRDREREEEREELEEREKREKERKKHADKTSSEINESNLNPDLNLFESEKIGKVFQEFCDTYPLKQSRTKIYPLFCNLINQGIAASDLLAAAKKYADAMSNTPAKYVKVPVNFLAQQVWLQFMPKYRSDCPDCHGSGIIQHDDYAEKCHCFKRAEDYKHFVQRSIGHDDQNNSFTSVKDVLTQICSNNN